MTIVILEDDPVWQLTLQMILEQLDDATIVVVESFEQAQQYFNQNTPDLVVADVILRKKLVFSLFQQVERSYPIIFITGSHDRLYLEKSSRLPNASLLIKPFHEISLLAAIQSLLNQSQTVSDVPPPGVSVTGKYRQEIIIPYGEIVYVEAEGNYATIQQLERKHLLKCSLRQIMPQLDGRFVQIQKSFIINTDYLKRVDLSAGMANVHGNLIPIGRIYRKSLLKHLKV